MLTEENPVAFASPEQKHEDDSKKKKKRKKRKKNNENSAQPNENLQLQVCSEPLVVTPNPEIKSNEESSLPDSNSIPKKKKQRKKKSVINAEAVQPNSEEPKPSLDLENKKEAEPIEIYVEGAKTPGGKRKQKSDIGKFDEVVVVENTLKHDLEQLNTVDTEEKTGKKHKRKRKRKRNKSELDGSQSNEQNIKGDETAVQTSIIDIEVPPVDPAISVNTQPANLAELEHKYLDSEEPKPSLDLENKKEAEPIEVYVEGAKTPEFDEVVVVENTLKHDQEQLNTVDTEEKTDKKHKRKRKRNKSELDGSQSNEQNIKGDETAVQTSIIDIEVPPVDPAISVNTQPANLAELEHKYLDRERMKRRRMQLRSKGEEETQEYNGKTVEIQVQRPIDPIMEPSTESKALESDRPIAGSTAETSVQGTKRVKVANAPLYQHGKSSMICWACRETNHTIQQCQKLKRLSKYEEICFFCGEIGHSLGKCSVYIAGGGRLARCLFCNTHGHFSYNCPGNGHYPKEQLPVEAEGKIQC